MKTINEFNKNTYFKYSGLKKEGINSQSYADENLNAITDEIRELDMNMINC